MFIAISGESHIIWFFRTYYQKVCCINRDFEGLSLQKLFFHYCPVKLSKEKISDLRKVIGTDGDGKKILAESASAFIKFNKDKRFELCYVLDNGEKVSIHDDSPCGF